MHEIVEDIQKINGVKPVLGVAFCNLLDAGLVIGEQCDDCDWCPTIVQMLLPQ